MNVTQRMAGLLKPNDVILRNGKRLRLRHINKGVAGVVRFHFQPAEEPLHHLNKNDVLILTTTGMAMFEVEESVL